MVYDSPMPIRRTWLARAAAALCALSFLSLVPAGSPARAADPKPFVVVGTSDVYDSNLVQTVIEPGFEAAYPEYDLQYVSKGTGAAIAYAQAGTAAALLVHAAALENQFVGDGYSLEKYGRAIFWGDYVLLGPNDDPAGVMATDNHDIVGAFEKIAAAGEAGDANFVSRGGTPGTTVAEHIIWSHTSGVTTCQMSDANGGGTSPSQDTGDCPASINYPDWYHATGLTQGPNIDNADVCNYPSDEGNCYVLTDRGTFQYLKSVDRAQHLKIVTRDNDDTSRGGQSLLVNSFHAYGINPAMFPDPSATNTDPVAAKLFLNWITSADTQEKVGQFLDPSDPPFIPSAAPTLTGSQLPKAVKAGSKVKVTGKLANVVPGMPALNGEKVSLMRVPTAFPGSTPTKVTTAKTNKKGKFSLTFKPTINATYSLSVGRIVKIEDSHLDPVFGDILHATSTSLSVVKVKGAVTVKKATVKNGRLKVSGALSPKVTGKKATVVLYAAHPGKKLKPVGEAGVKNGAKSYAASFTLGSGSWRYQVHYVNAGLIKAGVSSVGKVTVP